MANTFSNINDVKVAQSCLNALKHALMPLKVFTLDVGSEPTTKGATVYVPVITAGSATTNTTSYETGDRTAAGVGVTISQNISSSTHLSAVEASQTNTDIFEKNMVECAYEVGYKVLLNAFDLCTAAHFSAEQIVTKANFDADALLDAKEYAVQTLKMKASEGINVVADYGYYINLLKDPAVKDLSASGVRAGVEGEVTRFAGMDIWPTSVLASSTSYTGTEDTRVIICQPRCLGMTVRPPVILPGSSEVFESIENVTDPETGLTLQYRRWVSAAANIQYGCVEVLWGGDAIDGTAMYRLIAE